MSQDPYRSAPPVFWIMDNGSSHRGQRCADRLRAHWPTIVAVHTPVHTSWLNQVEVYFSVVERKVLTPNDFRSLVELEEPMIRFQNYYQVAAKPYFPRIAVVISREFIASASSHFGGSSCCGVRISEAVCSSQRASKEWISR